MSIINTVAAWDLMLFWNRIVPFEEFSVPGNGSTDFRILRFVLLIELLISEYIYYLITIVNKNTCLLSCKIFDNYKLLNFSFLWSNRTFGAFIIFKLPQFQNSWAFKLFSFIMLWKLLSCRNQLTDQDKTIKYWFLLDRTFWCKWCSRSLQFLWIQLYFLSTARNLFAAEQCQ